MYRLRLGHGHLYVSTAVRVRPAAYSRAVNPIGVRVWTKGNAEFLSLERMASFAVKQLHVQIRSHRTCVRKNDEDNAAADRNLFHHMSVTVEKMGRNKAFSDNKQLHIT